MPGGYVPGRRSQASRGMEEVIHLHIQHRVRMLEMRAANGGENLVPLTNAYLNASENLYASENNGEDHDGWVCEHGYEHSYEHGNVMHRNVGPAAHAANNRYNRRQLTASTPGPSSTASVRERNNADRAARFMSEHTDFLSHNAAEPPNTDCPICLESTEEHVCIQIKGCGDCKHVIGRECLEEFLKQEPDAQKQCPLCREEWLPDNTRFSDAWYAAEEL
ncbi:hypothetical protein N0V83_000751 [Neocucurbitaria cava]|uniref:RING-type domain-containing protein n=1 Tax=Neocucurbitaria cava TaxID=798079 RepID=A0A9W8YIF3_9PLEO|nr:hypothetical protein N0V83_000751 [Neocucurbitaria cava]